MVSSTYFAADVGGFGMHMIRILRCLAWGCVLLGACPELKATKVQRHMRVSKVCSKQAWTQPVAWLVPYTLQIHSWSEPPGFRINLLFWIAPLCWNSFSLVWVYSCASNLICKAAERHMPRTSKTKWWCAVSLPLNEAFAMDKSATVHVHGASRWTSFEFAACCIQFSYWISVYVEVFLNQIDIR